MAVIAHPDIEVVIEATGDPGTGIKLCQAAIAHGKHVVMVNVEADALAGPLLARRAQEAGVVYSLAWGDQPALICEHVDWARTCGFKVVAAGKGTRYHPTYHQSTPDTVWDILDTVPGDQGPQPHQSEDVQLVRRRHQVRHRDDGGVQRHGAGAADRTGWPSRRRRASSWPTCASPRAEGGTLEKKGVTEVVSSLYRDGKDVPHNLVMGTYVVIESDSPYAAQCCVEYNLLPDKSGKYAALYRPTHMIGLELGISVASAALQEGADRRADLLQLRRGGDRQARAEEGRDAGRRGRLPACGASRCRPTSR